MAIDFKTFSSIINPILNAKFPVLVRGRHGIGKSTMFIKRLRSWDSLLERASQMTEGDLLGLPKLQKVLQHGALTGLQKLAQSP